MWTTLHLVVIYTEQNYYQAVRAIVCDTHLNLRSWCSNSAELTTTVIKNNTTETPTSDKLHLGAKPCTLAHDQGKFCKA